MISIIIPCYNKSEYIIDTISSVKRQSFLKFECIIIDDCSTDSSYELILNEIHGDNRFKLFKNDANKGGSYSRNVGILKSSSDYIMFLDADDLLHENCLKNRFNYISNKSDVDFVVFKMGTFYKEIDDSQLIWSDFNKNHLKRFLSHDLPWHTMMVLWKKHIIEKLDGFQESFTRCQDVELHTRALISNYKYDICYGFEVDCYFRIDADRIKDNLTFIKRDIEGKAKYYCYFSQLLKGTKYFKYIKGTIFESYILIFEYYKNEIFSLDQCNDLIYFLESSFEFSNWTIFDRCWIRVFKYLRKRKVHFKGLNFLFKLILVK